MSNEDVLKKVSRKYPTCSVIDATEWDKDKIVDNCTSRPTEMVITHQKKFIDVVVCTGNFNVYVLEVNPRSDNAE